MKFVVIIAPEALQDLFSLHFFPAKMAHCLQRHPTNNGWALILELEKEYAFLFFYFFLQQKINKKK